VGLVRERPKTHKNFKVPQFVCLLFRADNNAVCYAIITADMIMDRYSVADLNIGKPSSANLSLNSEYSFVICAVSPGRFV